MKKEEASAVPECRCKESIGKTPSDIAGEVLKDLMFWKKGR